MSKKNTNIENLDTVVDKEKTFDEIMDEIFGEDEKNIKSDKEEFEEKILEVSKPCDIIEPENCVEEIENIQIYKFSDDARIGLFNGFSLDTGLGDGYRENTLLQTSHCLEITGHFNTRDLKIEKHPNSERFGHLEFIDKQMVNSLVVENVGLFGSFDVAIVSIRDSTYVEINLDITDKSKCTYLLIDSRFDRVRGKINISDNFYSQLNVENLKFLINVSKNSTVEICVEGMPISDYITKDETNKNMSFEYSRIKDMISETRIEV